MNFKIRQAKKEDLKEIAAIEAECFPPAEAASYDRFVSRFAVFPECFWVAELEDGTLAGMCNGAVTDTPILPDAMYADASLHKPDGGWQTLFGLTVRPAYQHQKIATHLMMTLIDAAAARGRKGVILTCKDHMMPFYDSLGFRWMGVSASCHGGAKWNDMLLVFDEKDLPEAYRQT